MNVTTTKQAVNAIAVLQSVTNSTFKLRSAECMAREAGVTEAEVVAIAQSLGLKKVSRRSDGVALYGIAGRVDGRDVAHTPIAVAQAAVPVAVRASRYTAQQLEKVREALNDSRWTMRSVKQLRAKSGVTDDQLDDIMNVLEASFHGDNDQYVGLDSRN